jgi:hypothetical protein
MAEDLSIIAGSKQEQYQSLFPRLKVYWTVNLIIIANIANTVAQR